MVVRVVGVVGRGFLGPGPPLYWESWAVMGMRIGSGRVKVARGTLLSGFVAMGFQGLMTVLGTLASVLVARGTQGAVTVTVVAGISGPPGLYEVFGSSRKMG
jgi:hypothetical protein